MTRDPRVDAYIARAQPFAVPILERLRAAFHEGCPDCEEAIKWSAPGFVYKGRTLGIMAAFKAHAALNLNRADEVDFAALGIERRGDEAMGQLGRIENVDTLPAPATLAALIRALAALEDAGPKKRASAPKPPVKVPPMPDAFAVALAANSSAKAAYDAFPPGAKRDYIEWIAEAKREVTRDQRIATAVEWIADGKKRNWKYEKC